MSSTHAKPHDAAAKSHDGAAKHHDGTVVSVAGDKLTTTCGEGKQHCHTVAKDAAVTCEGKPSKAADLAPGTPVRVTAHKDDKSVATAVESGKHIKAPAAVPSVSAARKA